MIKVYTGVKGFAISFFFIAGLVLCLSIFFWGITKAVELLLPLLIVVAYLLIMIFVLGFLPAAFIKDLRPSLCIYSMMMSHALGLVTWMVSFIFVMKAFGFFGVFFILLFQFLTPMAIIEAILKGAWHIAAHLSLWIAFTYGMKFYSQWLSNLGSHPQKKGHIIDIDAQVINQ